MRYYDGPREYTMEPEEEEWRGGVRGGYASPGLFCIFIINPLFYLPIGIVFSV